HFLHYAYENIEQFIDKQNKYSSLNPKKNNLLKALINPYWTFFKLYFVKLGFLEGKRGFIIAKLYSQYTFWKYIK
ncbi:TPA: glycosyltransferase family 2 protein, partial [Campylobacter jejuni]